jgi:hypothetical protein
MGLVTRYYFLSEDCFLKLAVMSFWGGLSDERLDSCSSYTGCPRRNVPDFGRVFFMVKYTDITQNTYVFTREIL